MKFTKMQGTGNDFVVLDSITNKLRLSAHLIRNLCDRHYGIGADGVIMILPPSTRQADFRMRMFNPDGSEAEMCGNGIRCLGKFVYEHNFTRKKRLIIETLAGLKPLDLFIRKNKVTQVRIAMGQPNQVLHNELLLRVSLSRARQVRRERIKGIKVLLGNPHYVIFVRDVLKFPVEIYGPLIERHPHFPNRTNVEFVQVINPHHIRQRTWERGVGETLACGTGTVAAVSAGIFTGQLTSKVKVDLTGGILTIEKLSNNMIYLTGPAQEVFAGNLNIY